MVNALFARTARNLGLGCRWIGDMLLIEYPRGTGVLRMAGVYNDLDGFAAGTICGDKVLSRRFLEEAGLPIPRGRSFRFDQETHALDFARELGTGPVSPSRRATPHLQQVSASVSGLRQRFDVDFGAVRCTATTCSLKSTLEETISACLCMRDAAFRSCAGRGHVWSETAATRWLDSFSKRIGTASRLHTGRSAIQN